MTGVTAAILIFLVLLLTVWLLTTESALPLWLALAATILLIFILLR